MNMLSAPEHEASQFESSPPGGQTILSDPSPHRFSDAYQESNRTGWFPQSSRLSRRISGTGNFRNHSTGSAPYWEPIGSTGLGAGGREGFDTCQSYLDQRNP